MKPTNLHSWYTLGISLERMYHNIGADKTYIDVFPYLIEPYNSLHEFLGSTEDMPLEETRVAAQYLHKFCGEIWKLMAMQPAMAEHKITQAEANMFFTGKEHFEKALEHEHRNLDVFTVMQKGIYDTRLLMRNPERDVAERLRNFLPAQTINDWREAGRSLAFDLPTACAFHICRGTEALVLRYYEVLAGHPWEKAKRDWKIYIEQLRVEKAPDSITSRLDEIRLMDRNAYTHPEKTVSVDEAPALFKLCSGVTFYMCQELEKLEKAKP